MGDRANILVKENKADNGVYLYSHWAGSVLASVLQKALRRSERLDDTQYLTRIIFCEMLKSTGDTPIDDTTGLGISAFVGDGDDRILEVIVDSQTVTMKGKDYTFTEFTEIENPKV